MIELFGTESLTVTRQYALHPFFLYSVYLAPLPVHYVLNSCFSGLMEVERLCRREDRLLNGHALLY